VAMGAVLAQQRLVGSIGGQIRVRLAGGATLGGVLRTVGPDFLMLTEAQTRDCLVPLGAVTAVEGLTSVTGAALTGLAVRLDLRRAVRGLARDRSPVSLALTGWTGAVATAGQGAGSVAAGSGEITGTIDRVGADFIEIAAHAAWEPRRAGAVRSVALVPITALVLVRAIPLG
jgi:hypothetical protein